MIKSRVGTGQDTGLKCAGACFVRKSLGQSLQAILSENGREE